MRSNALIAAGLATVAATFGGLGVALAGDGTSSATAPPPPAELQFTQEEQPPDRDGRDGRDCPKDRQGNGGGSSEAPSEAPPDATSL